MPRRSLVDSRILVTGASSGIGRALALELAGRGARMIVTARRNDRLRALLEELRPADAVELAGDITSPDVRSRLIELATDRWGGLDVLLNNAGVGAMGRFDGADPERLSRLMEVNFLAPAELTRLALPLLSKGRRPIIVNIGSVLGHVAVPLKSEYCASKFALRGFSDALRAELGSSGIDVLLVCPSTTDSEFFDRALEDTSGKNWKRLGAMPPTAVARRVVRAIERNQREIVLSTGGKLLYWAHRWFPSLTAALVSRSR